MCLASAMRWFSWVVRVVRVADHFCSRKELFISGRFAGALWRMNGRRASAHSVYGSFRTALKFLVIIIWIIRTWGINACRQCCEIYTGVQWIRNGLHVGIKMGSMNQLRRCYCDWEKSLYVLDSVLLSVYIYIVCEKQLDLYQFKIICVVISNWKHWNVMSFPGLQTNKLSSFVKQYSKHKCDLS